MPKSGKPKRFCMVLLAHSQRVAPAQPWGCHGCPARNGSSLAAALALAGVLALAAVLVGLAAALAFASVLALTSVLAFGVVERLRAHAANVGLKGGSLAVVALSARDDTGDSCCDENRGHVDT